MMQITKSAWGMIVLTAVMLAGCRAAPAPSAGFADPTLLKPDPTVPFDKFWRKPGLDWYYFDKIYVAEVNTSYMLKTTDWQQGERKGQIEKDIHKLAGFMHGSIIKAFRDDPKHRFQIVDSPNHDPHCLVLEVALIEVVPSKVLLNTLEYAPFFVGTGITVVRTIANDKSTAAFEARGRDAATGQIVVLAADCESQQFAVVDVRSLTWYSDIDGIIDDWSKQFVEIANQKTGEKIAAASTFRLLPW
jgi:Protein of unknown function (DUF3313)